jgi:ParB/RepB/Spo0J family partition protein
MEMETQQVYDIPLGEIQVDTAVNVRKTGAETDLAELADSIRALGLLQPIVLRGEYGNPPYKLVVGQRRFLAHKDILSKKDKKFGTIRAIFRPGLSDLNAKISSLAENMHRVELNHADALEAVTALYKHFGQDVNKVSRVTGLSVTRVNRYLKIKDRASKAALEMLQKGQVKVFDMKRALDIAGADQKRADRILKAMSKLKTAGERRRAAELASEKANATEAEIIEAGHKPRIRTRISVDLTANVLDGLKKASKNMEMEQESVAALAIEEWLRGKGFVV